MFSATSFEKTGVYSEFLFWVQSVKNPDGTPRYTPSQINYYPTLQTAVAILGTYLMTVYCDYTGNRFVANVIMYISVLISSIMLLVWNIGIGGHFFAYSISGIGYAGQASNFAWANSLTRDDEMLRSLTLFSMNLFSNIWALWYGIAIWPVKHKPRFTNGQIATIVTGAVSVGVAGAIAYCARRYSVDSPAVVEDAEKKEAYATESVDEKDVAQITH
jgi:ACS family pantothenate transporter-like MFS transporter